MKPAVFTPQGRRDLQGAAKDLGNENPMAARALREAIKKATRLLGEYPFAGQERTDITSRDVRFLVVHGFEYVIVYDPYPSPAEIQRVLHTKRDLNAILDEDH
ncbi:plasmid stabilization system [Magnetococcus marinus MC-1]|uniref:Plasmid stabilization system n=1 Tax=Magnetococcus marinus (strain ATCC BAA-1437 / JCM 17883 / MC-1) TaxID=156889 RepID=A0L9B7_MAGMM|nr:type II toxin-antitoxin system RelE/ParE family toxin [Magnetococcus marinus]ABK44560.1 plasmid stabilization system [Magnetococcus marinus MC-1]ABK45250.1 plasmid stabilization system [Magnetococcus marinus MC-1]